MQIEPIFPQAVIGLNKLKVDPNKVLKYIQNLEFKISEPSKEEEAAEVYISRNFNIFEDIDYLRDEIYNNIKNYLNNIMKLNMNFQFTKSWVTKTLPNGFSQRHLHQNSFLSGVYYPVGDKNFNIRFYKKIDFWSIETVELNFLNAGSYTVNINENGILILFPSDLLHSIEKNLSDKTRYSIAFNTLPLGEMGTGDSRINFK
jgi:uncharacterized protein (TIGR02466 family)